MMEVNQKERLVSKRLSKGKYPIKGTHNIFRILIIYEKHTFSTMNNHL